MVEDSRNSCKTSMLPDGPPTTENYFLLAKFAIYGIPKYVLFKAGICILRVHGVWLKLYHLVQSAFLTTIVMF